MNGQLRGGDGLVTGGDEAEALAYPGVQRRPVLAPQPRYGASRAVEHTGDAEQRRRLAGAVRAEERDDLARADRQGQVPDDLDVAVSERRAVHAQENLRRHGIDLRGGHHAFSLTVSVVGRDISGSLDVVVGVVTQIGGHDGAVLANLARRARGDPAAELEYDDPVTGGHHHVHVVLDQQDAIPPSSRRARG